MKYIKIPINTIQHMALLEVLEYALTCAETEIDCHTVNGEIDPTTDWDPSNLEPWTASAKQLAEVLDALPHVIDQAQEVHDRISALAGTTGDT